MEDAAINLLIMGVGLWDAAMVATGVLWVIALVHLLKRRD